MIIFGDESGWTGPDLLDAAQPVLATSTLRLQASKAAELADRFFGHIANEELKFGELTRSPEGQKAILEFLRWMFVNRRRQRSYVMHKRFVLVAKLVDTLVENATYRRGGDLYANGGHIILMNALHHAFPKFAGDLVYTDLLRRFQDLARKPTKTALDHFFALVTAPHEPRAEEVLAPLRFVRETVDDESLLDDLKKADLDALGTSLWSVAFAWNQAAPTETLHVVFDEQSKLKTETKAWAVLKDPTFRPPGVARLPIVDVFEFGNSVTHPGIQLADVLAGSLRLARAAQVLPPTPGDDRMAAFRAEVSGLVEKLEIIRIWPDAGYAPHNGLIDYARAQDLVTATALSMHRRRAEKRR